MSNAPFNIRSVIALLEDNIPALQHVGGAADLAVVRKPNEFRTPSAYAILPEESARLHPTGTAAPGTTSKVRQVVNVMFGVTIAVRNYRYDRGQVAADELDPILEAVRNTIIGWTPDLPMARPCQFVSGRIITYDAGVMVWSDVYQTQHSIGR